MNQARTHPSLAPARMATRSGLSVAGATPDQPATPGPRLVGGLHAWQCVDETELRAYVLRVPPSPLVASFAALFYGPRPTRMARLGGLSVGSRPQRAGMGGRSDLSPTPRKCEAATRASGGAVGAGASARGRPDAFMAALSDTGKLVRLYKPISFWGGRGLFEHISRLAR